MEGNSPIESIVKSGSRSSGGFPALLGSQE